MKKVNLLLILMASTMLFSSCATIMSGSRQDITINSEPSDATVYIVKKNSPDVAIGKTPMTTAVKRTVPKLVVKKDGYKDTILFCHSKKMAVRSVDANGIMTKKRVLAGKYYAGLNLWFIGDIFLGLIPILVDNATGAYIRLDKNMSVTLAKKSEPVKQKEQKSTPATKTKEDRLKELKKLYDEKVITKEEYSKSREKILNEQ
jgi:hypothetical protein